MKNNRSDLIKLACYALIAYLLGWALISSPVYSLIALRPDQTQNELYNLDKILDTPRQEYYFDSQNNKLHGWLFPKPNSNVLIIIHHGNAGNILNRLFLAKTFIQSGASVFLYDYRGYGKSAGEASLKGILEDGLTAFDFAKNKFNYPIIINYGESIGSGVACNVDHCRKANALILQSGIKSLPNVARDGVMLFKLYPNCLWQQPQLDNGILLSRSKTPLLLLHGERDTLVLANHSQYLYSCAAAPDKLLVKLPNCGHNDVGLYDTEIFQKAINDFLTKQSLSAHPQ